MRHSESGARILLDPAIQGTHHKQWTLASMVATDIRQRAIPWSRLLLLQRGAARHSQPGFLCPDQRRRQPRAVARGRGQAGPTGTEGLGPDGCAGDRRQAHRGAPWAEAPPGTTARAADRYARPVGARRHTQRLVARLAPQRHRAVRAAG